MAHGMIDISTTMYSNPWAPTLGRVSRPRASLAIGVDYFQIETIGDRIRHTYPSTTASVLKPPDLAANPTALESKIRAAPNYLKAIIESHRSESARSVLNSQSAAFVLDVKSFPKPRHVIHFLRRYTISHQDAPFIFSPLIARIQ